ncbi:MAG: hypothetical protein DMG11_22245 [Acidobacteria bacterium]|nr:MAG: hypothetical protein DMG11_22245 [Acidobacteriota bacterium]
MGAVEQTGISIQLLNSMNPFINRRVFFQIAGTGVAGCFVSPFDLFARTASPYPPQAPQVTLLNTAKNVIFILLAGAPSQIDTFDLKVGPWTPADFRATTINGIDFPEGLMPAMASQLNRIAIVRSCQSSALVHALLQTWTQVARSPASATGKIAPNIGSVVALEFEPKRAADQRLPGFVALNSTGGLVKQGYLPGRYSPFDVVAGNNGLANITNPDGDAAFAEQYSVLQALEAGGIRRSDFDDMRDFYSSAREIMNDPGVNAAFRTTGAERVRYGNNTFGTSCIVARNLVNANLGTRYIQISLGGWDNHQNIYTPNAGIYPPARQLDAGLANLISDLATMPGANGRTRLDETLIVVKGEFGRTVGSLTDLKGRDHYFVHFALFAGGGVRGGQVLGETGADGQHVELAGWSEDRPVLAEDIAATIYSALGIDYTTVRRDDPLGRGFEYVPSTNDWLAYPIRELF